MDARLECGAIDGLDRLTVPLVQTPEIGVFEPGIPKSRVSASVSSDPEIGG
jgi:hypothetical protein